MNINGYIADAVKKSLFLNKISEFDGNLRSYDGCVTFGCELESAEDKGVVCELLADILSTFADVKLVLNGADDRCVSYFDDEMLKRVIFVDEKPLAYAFSVDIYIAISQEMRAYLAVNGKYTLGFPGGRVSLQQTLKVAFNGSQKWYFNHLEDDGMEKLLTPMDIMRFYYKESLPEFELEKLICSEHTGNEVIKMNFGLMLKYPDFRQRAREVAQEEVLYFRNKKLSTRWHKSFIEKLA